jgi:transketolase
VIPDEIYDGWRFVGELGAQTREAWDARLKASDKADTFTAQLAAEPPKAALDALDAHIQKTLSDKPALATRASSGKAIEAFWQAFPGLIGGSADLTGSNNTHAPGMASITPDDFSGSYVHYGVREHRHGGGHERHGAAWRLPALFGHLPGVSDYCRGAIRLSALMNQPVIYVFTHDSIGLGEDGPTHQPVEHLTALRSMPNVAVYRPAMRWKRRKPGSPRWNAPTARRADPVAPESSPCAPGRRRDNLSARALM